jgi:competence protein ComEC
MDYSKRQCDDRRLNVGMIIYASAFLLGVLAVQQLSVLPVDSILSVAFVIACLCLVLIRYNAQNTTLLWLYLTLTLYLIVLFILGFILSSFYAEKHLSQRLDDALIGQNIVINGYVSSIPVTIDTVQRFEFNVDSHSLQGKDLNDLSSLISDQKFPKKIRLSWYYGSTVSAGERWKFQVRLKPPHGFMNPGGFDYEAWLFHIKPCGGFKRT